MRSSSGEIKREERGKKEGKRREKKGKEAPEVDNALGKRACIFHAKSSSRSVEGSRAARALLADSSRRRRTVESTCVLAFSELHTSRVYCKQEPVHQRGANFTSLSTEPFLPSRVMLPGT